MRVCQVTPEFPPMQGGVGDYTSLLAQALAHLGVEVTIVTSDRARTAHPTGPQVSYVPSWGFDCWRRIIQQIRMDCVDALHVQYQTGGYNMRIAINLLPLRLRLMQQRPRVIVTFHDLKAPYLFPKAGRIRSLPGILLATFADAVIVTNHEDLARIGCVERGTGKLHTKFGMRPLYAIPIGSNILPHPLSGYDRQRWRSARGIADDDVVLCYFGFLNSAKGIDTLLEAFQMLCHRGLKVKLLMAGGAFGDSDPSNRVYGKGIIDTIERSSYKRHVLWTGFADAKAISAALFASDICVLPFNEGVSLRHGTLMAAIAHSLPIVTTEGPALSDNFSGPLPNQLPSLRGYVKTVSPRQPEALADALEQLIRKEDERAALQNKIAELRAAFAWEDIAARTLAVYRSLTCDLRSESQGSSQSQGSSSAVFGG